MIAVASHTRFRPMTRAMDGQDLPPEGDGAVSDQNGRSHDEPSAERKADFSPTLSNPECDVLAELTRLAGVGTSSDHQLQIESLMDDEAQCDSIEDPCTLAGLAMPTGEPTLDRKSQGEIRAVDWESESTEGTSGQPAAALPGETLCLVFRPPVRPTLVAPEPAYGSRRGFAVAATLIGILGGIVGGGASLTFRDTSSAPPVIRAENGPASIQAQAVPSEGESAGIRQPVSESYQRSKGLTPVEAASTPALTAAGLREPEPSASHTEPAGPVAQPAARLKVHDATPVQAQAVPSAGENIILSQPGDEIQAKPVKTVTIVPERSVKSEPIASPTLGAEPAPQSARMPARLSEVTPPQQDAMVATSARPEALAVDGPWSVQLASEKSESDALAAFEHIRNEHQTILGGLRPQVTKAELGAKGTYYRVRIGAKSQQAANKLCASLQAAGRSCWVQRN